MTNQIIGYMLIVLSWLLYILFAVALLAMVYAFTVETTIAAVESAFGLMVIGFLFFAMAKYSYRAANKRIKTEDEPS